VLPYDERPRELELEFGIAFGAEQFRLVDTPHKLRATLIQYPSSSGPEYQLRLDPEGRAGR
jgi:hypothetical protein